jgi:hypothetical protein
MVEASPALPSGPLVLVRRTRPAGPTPPPVTLLALAGAAREAGAAEVQVLDGALLSDDQELGARLQAARPGTVVVDGEDRDASGLAADLRALRALAPEARFIVRPPHGRDPREDLPGADFVLGGSPSTLAALLRPAADLEQVPGVAWRDAEGRLRTGRSAPESPTLDHAAPLAWDLVDPRAYGLGLGSAALVTARACPEGCPSCHHSFGRTVRYRPLAEVEAEAHSARARGAAELVVLDEAFDHDPTHALAVAEALARVGFPRLVLANPLLAEAVDERLARALAAAGLKEARLKAGPPPRLQGLLRSHQDRRALAASARALQEAGIAVRLELTLGWPGEDATDRRSTARLAWSLPWTRLSVRPAWEAGVAATASVMPAPPRALVLRDALALRLLAHLQLGPWLRRARAWKARRSA